MAADEGAVKAVEQRWGKDVKLIGKWGGRILVFVALAESTYTVYQAENKAKAITTEVGGWAGAWLGANLGAEGGAVTGAVLAIGAGNSGPQILIPEEAATVPIAAGAGGLLGGTEGGIGGFFFGRETTETVYEWIFE